MVPIAQRTTYNRRFFTGSFNVPVVDRTRLQKSAYVKFWRLGKGLSINLEGNLPFEKKENR